MSARAEIAGVGFCKLKLKRFGGLQRLRDALARVRACGMEPVLGDGLSSEIDCWMEACASVGLVSKAGEFNGFLKPCARLFDQSACHSHRGSMRLPAHFRPEIDPDLLTRARDRLRAVFRVMCRLRPGPSNLLPLLCALYLILYLDRVNIATAAPLIQSELHLSNAALGVVLSAFAYTYAFCQLIGGLAGEKFGPRTTLLPSVVVVCLATAATGFAAGLAGLIAARIALGLGEGAALPTATQAMARQLPQSRWGFAQGITHSFARLGNFVTPPIVAALIAFSSWRAAFFVLVRRWSVLDRRLAGSSSAIVLRPASTQRDRMPQPGLPAWAGGVRKAPRPQPP